MNVVNFRNKSDFSEQIWEIVNVLKDIKKSIENSSEIDSEYYGGSSTCLPINNQTCAAYCPGGEYCIQANQDNCIPFINEYSCGKYMPLYYQHLLKFCSACEYQGGEIFCETSKSLLNCECIFS